MLYFDSLREMFDFCHQNTEIMMDYEFEKDRRRGWICPCGSGSGKNGTGISLFKANGYHLRCWSCGMSGDVIDFIAYKYGISQENHREKIKKVCDLYGLKLPEYKKG